MSASFERTLGISEKRQRQNQSIKWIWLQIKHACASFERTLGYQTSINLTKRKWAKRTVSIKDKIDYLRPSENENAFETGRNTWISLKKAVKIGRSRLISFVFLVQVGKIEWTSASRIIRISPSYARNKWNLTQIKHVCASFEKI